MAQKRVRKWAREYLERNGASTAQEVFQYIQQKSNRIRKYIPVRFAHGMEE